MTFLEISVFVYVIMGLTEASIPCNHVGAEFYKPDVIKVMERCLEKNECFAPRNFPELLVQNIRSRYHLTSIEVNVIFDCAGLAIQHLPLQLQQQVNATGFFADPYNSQCASKEEICAKNSQFVYPVICFLESACGIDAAHQAYALYYALELAATGMNKPLRCGETDKFDVNVGGSFQRFCPLNSNEKTALNGQSPPY